MKKIIVSAFAVAALAIPAVASAGDGGAYGKTWQDATGAGSDSATAVHQHEQCPDSRCLPAAQARHSSAGQLPSAGGAMVAWLP